MSKSAECIARLIGDAHTPEDLIGLLNEVGNGDRERARKAKAILFGTAASPEILATLQVAIHIDTIANDLGSLQQAHNDIHGVGGRGCVGLRIHKEKVEKRFFRGICLLVVIPLFIWAVISIGGALWKRQQGPSIKERTVQYDRSRSSSNSNDHQRGR